MRHTVIGLDVSANRIAVAMCDSVVFLGSRIVRRDTREYSGGFVRDGYRAYLDLRMGVQVSACCIEINLHPKVLYRGHISVQMIRAYMRSRWIEGALLHLISLEEPSEIIRRTGGHYQGKPGKFLYSMAATGGEDAKDRRRERMRILYGPANVDPMSEDEADALAISHDCSVALAVIQLRSS